MSEVNQELRDRKYNDWARRNPAIVSIVFPLLVVLYFFQEYTAELSSVRYIVGVILSFGSIIPALFFFYQSSIREISVLLVEIPLFFIFGRPAANLMKKKNGILSAQRKDRILAKAKAAGIEAIYTDEDKSKCCLERRKIAREAFEKIRETCRENPVVFEFNCTYGFFRNLSGGLIVDLLICGGLAYYNCKNTLNLDQMISTSVIIIAALLFFSLICTYFSAVRYAKRVYVLYDN